MERRPGIDPVKKPRPVCWGFYMETITNASGRPPPAAPPTRSKRGMSRRECTDIGFRHISPHHSRAIEVCTNLADRLLHHPDPSRPVVVIKGEYDVFELAIKIG